jgi:uncharacterized YigZ family protein
MLIPGGSAEFELIIKKSRFIASAEYVESPEDARALVKKRKSEHSDAAHVVHAFISGDDRQYMGMSDDGEPSGTSGKPVLEVLKGGGITNVIITVVRYFGGTKLGTGGLVKAYSGAASGVMERLKTIPLIKYRKFRLKTNYHDYGPLKALLEERGCLIDDESFGTEVDIIGQVPDDGVEALENSLIDASCGRAEVSLSDVL